SNGRGIVDRNRGSRDVPAVASWSVSWDVIGSSAQKIRRDNLKQRAAENDAGNREVNHKAGDVHECCDKRGGCTSGVETELSQDKRKHRPSDGAEENYANEACANRRSDQQVVRPVKLFSGGNGYGLPHENARHAYRT